MVRHQQLITAFEAQRAENGVDTGGRIRHEHQTFRLDSEEFRQLTAGFIEEFFKVANEELDRLALEAVANLSLKFEHCPRAGPERAVVQVNHPRVERPKPRAAGRAVLFESSYQGLISRWSGASLIESRRKPDEHRRDRPAR